MARIELDTDAIFQQVMQKPKVKAKVHGRAAKITTRIRRDLNKAGIDADVTIKEYAHDNGRFGVNIIGSVDERNARRAGRIARRAGRSVRR
ncbi:hypothetical protein [Corynebacterium striatum]|uniref:hypothetical protein n=1 Tax=Corynebacterium striatum TaxID=43770 RepID=UPI003B5B510C